MAWSTHGGGVLDGAETAVKSEVVILQSYSDVVMAKAGAKPVRCHPLLEKSVLKLVKTSVGWLWFNGVE